MYFIFFEYILNAIKTTKPRKNAQNRNPNGDKKMSDRVVKDNSLINASFKMDLVEHRLMNLAITEARETQNGLSADSFLTIHASKYMKIFGGEKQTAYKALKTACDSLFLRQFSYYSLTETGKESFIVVDG